MTTPHEELLQYPGLYAVDIQPGSFNSGLKTLTSFKSGQIMTYLTGTTDSPRKTWATVQCGTSPNDNIKLNSVLVFVNHSCGPNVALDLSSPNRSEWHYRALRDIEANEDLGVFYPSTEWDMTQGFKCRCRAKNCLGNIQGAKYLTRQQVEERGFISSYISDLMKQRDGV